VGFKEPPRGSECPSTSQVHQPEDVTVIVEVMPMSVIDDRAQQDDAALRGSTAWAAKPKARENSLSDDRQASCLRSIHDFAL